MRRTRDLRHREAQPRQRRPKVAEGPNPPRVRRHPLFGEIPLVPESWTDPAGRERIIYTYDLDYQPALPKGAIRGNVRKQHFCPQCDVPRYFYVDLELTCAECGRRFVFSGGEQKFWYEDLQFHFGSVAKRCAACRRKRRSEKLLQGLVVRASADVEAQPDDPLKLLALGAAI